MVIHIDPDHGDRGDLWNGFEFNTDKADRPRFQYMIIEIRNGWDHWIGISKHYYLFYRLYFYLLLWSLNISQ
jgi:hypothetical protein